MSSLDCVSTLVKGDMTNRTASVGEYASRTPWQAITKHTGLLSRPG